MAIYSIEWGWQASQDLHSELFFTRKAWWDRLVAGTERTKRTIVRETLQAETGKTAKQWRAGTGSRNCTERLTERGTTPRGDTKSSEVIENRRDGRAPSYKRVCNCLKILELEGCDRKERSWKFRID